VDLIGTGMVASLAHPGENITGFSLLELSVIGKFLELLKQIAPNVSRVALIYNPDNPSTRFFKQEFEKAAPALAVEPIIAHIHGWTTSRAPSRRWRDRPTAGFCSRRMSR